ncbi:sulfotransferase domain-containing protein [Zobellella denitrificans]
MKKIIIHPGAHKTGTTYLQRVLEKNLKDETHIWFKTRSFFYHNITRPLIEKKEKTLENNAQQLLLSAVQDYDKILISEENISGRFYCWNENEFYPDMNKNILKLTKALRKQPTEHTIDLIFTIRNHADWYESMYLQKVKNGYATNFEKFREKTKIENISFSKLINKLSKQEHININVLLYEDFKKGQKRHALKN